MLQFVLYIAVWKCVKISEIFWDSKCYKFGSKCFPFYNIFSGISAFGDLTNGICCFFDYIYLKNTTKYRLDALNSKKCCFYFLQGAGYATFAVPNIFRKFYIIQIRVFAKSHNIFFRNVFLCSGQIPAREIPS